MTTPLPPLTLIVAATHPTLGIGLRSTLPWPHLPRELAYFARTTTRPPPGHPTATNAVVMGRKTWASLPARSRPLKRRTNVVVSRSPDTLGLPADGAVLGVRSVREGLLALRERGGVGRVFVIGGAEIYGAVVGMRECRRVLLTRVRTRFECDVFFPVELGKEGGGWVRRGKEEMDEWVGEEVPGGVQVEGGVEYEFEMWEREGEGEGEGGG